MKKLVLSVGVLFCFASTGQVAGQGKSVAVATVNQNSNDGFVVQNQTVVLRMAVQSSKVKPQDVALTKDVVLANGTKIDWKGRAVQYADGRRVELQDGDFVAMNGDVKVASSGKLITAAPAPAPIPAASAAPVSFAYKAAEPVNGRLKGVVELGASGFNSFIVRIDEQRRWKMEKAEFGNSLVMENLATEDDIRRGLKAYIGQMLDFGVPARDIHFVVSSGAAKAESTTKIVKSLKALNYVVKMVTPEEEGTLALRATLPTTYADKGFVVDIGSANTKISWLQGDKVGATETYGAKYFQQNTADSLVAADVRQKATQVPAARRATCFIIGGVPYELSKIARQDKSQRYVLLNAPESYAQISAAKTKAGVNIYQAIATATGCQQFVFDSEVNFTVGYLLTLPK